MGQMRLDRFLTEMGKGSRSRIKQDVRKGLVQVNGQVIKAPDSKLDPETDQVTYAGTLVPYAAMEYYLLNKPAGYVSATEDRHEKTVLELIPERKRKDLFPVGRLDKDTEGLLLITNDGELAHRLLHPKRHVDKTYYAEVAGPLTGEMVRQFAEGVDIGDDTPTLPAVLKAAQRQKKYRDPLGSRDQGVQVCREQPEERQEISCVEITLHEGRFHQIKRMFQAVGSEVLYLKRISMGPLCLDRELPIGKSRPLTEDEKAALGVGIKNGEGSRRGGG